MDEFLTQMGGIENVIKWVVGVGTGLAVIWGWIAKPLRDVNKGVGTFKEEMKGQMMDLREDMGNLQGTTDFILGDRLAQAHSYWTRRGYCPPADKGRLVDMHKVYKARGLNHLYDSYEQDLLDLPPEPPKKQLAHHGRAEEE